MMPCLTPRDPGFHAVGRTRLVDLNARMPTRRLSLHDALIREAAT